MAHQPNLFSANAQNDLTTRHRPPAPSPGKIPVWLRRVELLLYVVVRIYLGVILLVIPWTPLWTSNRFLTYYPGVEAILMHGAVRGIISGIGLLDLWIALDEAVHYHEKEPK